jgi:hypothetical protein
MVQSNTCSNDQVCGACTSSLTGRITTSAKAR